MNSFKDATLFMDLSFLSSDEEAVIRQVLLRDEDLKRLEIGRVRRLRNSVPDPKQLKVQSGDWFEELRSRRYGHQPAISAVVRSSMRWKKSAGHKPLPFLNAVLEERDGEKEEKKTRPDVSADPRSIHPALSAEVSRPYRDEDISVEFEAKKSNQSPAGKLNSSVLGSPSAGKPEEMSQEGTILVQSPNLEFKTESKSATITNATANANNSVVSTTVLGSQSVGKPEEMSQEETIFVLSPNLELKTKSKGATTSTNTVTNAGNPVVSTTVLKSKSVVKPEEMSQEGTILVQSPNLEFKTKSKAATSSTNTISSMKTTDTTSATNMEPRRKVSLSPALQKDQSFEENWVKISLETNSVETKPKPADENRPVETLITSSVQNPVVSTSVQSVVKPKEMSQEGTIFVQSPNLKPELQTKSKGATTSTNTVTNANNPVVSSTFLGSQSVLKPEEMTQEGTIFVQSPDLEFKSKSKATTSTTASTNTITKASNPVESQSVLKPEEISQEGTIFVQSPDLEFKTKSKATTSTTTSANTVTKASNPVVSTTVLGSQSVVKPKEMSQVETVLVQSPDLKFKSKSKATTSTTTSTNATVKASNPVVSITVLGSQSGVKPKEMSQEGTIFVQSPNLEFKSKSKATTSTTMSTNTITKASNPVESQSVLKPEEISQEGTIFVQSPDLEFKTKSKATTSTTTSANTVTKASNPVVSTTVLGSQSVVKPKEMSQVETVLVQSPDLKFKSKSKATTSTTTSTNATVKASNPVVSITVLGSQSGVKPKEMSQEGTIFVQSPNLEFKSKSKATTSTTMSTNTITKASNPVESQSVLKPEEISQEGTIFVQSPDLEFKTKSKATTSTKTSANTITKASNPVVSTTVLGSQSVVKPKEMSQEGTNLVQSPDLQFKSKSKSYHSPVVSPTVQGKKQTHIVTELMNKDASRSLEKEKEEEKEERAQIPSLSQDPHELITLSLKGAQGFTLSSEEMMKSEAPPSNSDLKRASPTRMDELDVNVEESLDVSGSAFGLKTPKDSSLKPETSIKNSPLPEEETRFGVKSRDYSQKADKKVLEITLHDKLEDTKDEIDARKESDILASVYARALKAKSERPKNTPVPDLTQEKMEDVIPSIVILPSESEETKERKSEQTETSGPETPALPSFVVDTWEDEGVDSEDDISSVSSFGSDLSGRRGFSASTLSVTERTGSLLSVYSDAGDFGNVTVQGSVEFALMYSPLGELVIMVEQCQDLAIANQRKQRTDPYVKTYLYPDKRSKRKTSIKKRTINPVYVESLRYKVKREELPGKTLNLSVWHNDSRGRNVFLGEVELNLRNWDWGHEALTWYNLQPKNADNQESQEYRGLLSVSLKYVPPTGGSKSGTGEIHVWLREARQLRRLKVQGVDSFVKCYMLPDTSKKSRQKTRVVKKSLNPVYNHAMVYDGFRPDEVCEACCELSVWDSNTLSHQFLGGVRLSLGTGLSYGKKVDWMDSVNEEIEIWEKMMENANSWVEADLPLRASMTPRKK